jgi:hypothetical protein
MIALLAALAIRKTRWWGKAILAALCLFPSVYNFTKCTINGWLFRTSNAEMWFYAFEHGGPWQCCIDGTIQFVPRSERDSKETGYIVRFNCNKQQLDDLVIKETGKYGRWSRVAPGQLCNPNDTFNNPIYLRIGNADELYQWRHPYKSALLTLKVNKEHTLAIFRYETADMVAQQLAAGASPNSVPLPR